MIGPLLARLPQHAFGVNHFERPEPLDILAVMPDPTGVFGRHGISGVPPGSSPALQPVLPPEAPGGASNSIPDVGNCSHRFTPPAGRLRAMRRAEIGKGLGHVDTANLVRS